MVALNKPSNGRMNGIGAIDYQCYKDAQNAGLDAGTFRAFLSDSYQDISSLVSERYKNLPIANIKVNI